MDKPCRAILFVLTVGQRKQLAVQMTMTTLNLNDTAASEKTLRAYHIFIREIDVS